MKTLLLLRHAKSSWGDPSLADFNRPLNERGLRAVPRVGCELARRGVTPDKVLASPAQRTRETAELVSKAARLDAKIVFDQRIYAASLARLLEVLRDATDADETILLVGHNPGLEELLAHLTGGVLPMPTAALAKLDLDVDSWRRIDAANAHLDWFVKPRDLE